MYQLMPLKGKGAIFFWLFVFFRKFFRSEKKSLECMQTNSKTWINVKKIAFGNKVHTTY